MVFTPRNYLPKTIFGQTILAVVLGVFIGLFFGDHCSILKPISTIYIGLTQIVLYPFLICTLLSGFGQLAPSMATKLLERTWIILLALIVVCFGVIGILATAIPTSIGLEVELPKPVNFNIVDLLISHNVFAALSQSQIPAVIIFCMILAFMLQRAKNADNLFQVLDLISNACIDFWRVLVKIAPFCIGATVAYFAGTVKPSQLAESGFFLFLFYVGSFMLAFWLLPVMTTNLIPIRYKTLMLELRDAIIIVATTSSVLGIPYVQNIASKFFGVDPKEKSTPNEVIKSTLTMAFAFGFAGPYFVYLFIVFAALYFNHPLQDLEKLMLPLLTYFAAMAGHIAAVLYLIDWLQLPKETSTLYLSIVPVIQPNINILNVMSIAFLTLVGSSAYFKRLEIKPWPLAINFALAAVVLFFTIQVKHWIPDPTTALFERLMNSEIPPDLSSGIKFKYLPDLNEKDLKPEVDSEDSLYRIQKTNVLRVGYNPSLIPFSFYNARLQLVGFDVAYMYALARSLHARIEFIPYTSPYLISDLQANAFDIAIGGLIVTEQSLPYVSFSNAYMKTFPSFIIPNNRRNEFKNLDSIEQIPNLKIGVLGSPALISLLQGHFPHATIVVLKDLDTSFLEAFQQKKVDAIFWSKVRSDAWILGHPGFTSLTPDGLAAPFLLSYMVQKQSTQFLSFLNYWLELKDNDGFHQQMYDHWVLVHPLPDKKRRWSIMRNVLHWET